MRRTILHLALVGLALILSVATAFAEPPTKLYGIPFGGGYRDFQVLGPVSQSEIWLLANTDYYSETGVSTARCELFSTDGTVAGTRKLVDVVPEGTCGPISKGRIFDGARFYFGMERKLTAGISEGNELQIVSTAEASQKVIFPGAPSSFPDNFIQFKGRIYFAATNLSNGR